MPSFPKPKFPYSYNVDDEITALRTYRDNKPCRTIPRKTSSHLLIATWNIANLGLQDRRTRDYKLLAEMINWFDLVALQEVNDDLSGLRRILKQLPASFRTIFSDKAGNQERAAFVYDSSKVQLLEKVGEIAIPPTDQKHIKLPGVSQKFRGFDRNPFLASFQAGSFKFILVNVHLYFGDDQTAARKRRSLEAYAAARWGDLRQDDKDRYLDYIVALGDFNLPKYVPGDPIYDALKRRGLEKPAHSSKIASNIVNDKDYDQIMFFPKNAKSKYTGKTGVFDFDGGIFAKLWQTKSLSKFRAYLRYYISDHRILWAQFRT
jgi:endonuclease/exonuclease/phosphatase family metal-dependent hydrolase